MFNSSCFNSLCPARRRSVPLPHLQLSGSMKTLTWPFPCHGINNLHLEETRWYKPNSVAYGKLQLQAWARMSWPSVPFRWTYHISVQRSPSRWNPARAPSYVALRMEALTMEFAWNPLKSGKPLCWAPWKMEFNMLKPSRRRADASMATWQGHGGYCWTLEAMAESLSCHSAMLHVPWDLSTFQRSLAATLQRRDGWGWLGSDADQGRWLLFGMSGMLNREWP